MADDDPRKYGEDHINKSIKQINSETWLIGNLILHRSPYPSNKATWNDDVDKSSYTLTIAPTPLPSATTPADSPHITLVNEAGDAMVLWRIGHKVCCKASYYRNGDTPESNTINFVRDQQPSFETPKVLHHAFFGNRSFLFMQWIPGPSLSDAWPDLDEYWRGHYTEAVAKAAMEMAGWKGHAFGGVDGQNIPLTCLSDDWSGGYYQDTSSASLTATCKLLGMDCSNFVFSHNFLDLDFVIVEKEPKTGKIGIFEWDAGGFVPRSWIRTKFKIDAGSYRHCYPDDDRKNWPVKIQHELKDNGFDEVSKAFWEWRNNTKKSSSSYYCGADLLCQLPDEEDP